MKSYIILFLVYQQNFPMDDQTEISPDVRWSDQSAQSIDFIPAHNDWSKKLDCFTNTVNVKSPFTITKWSSFSLRLLSTICRLTWSQMGEYSPSLMNVAEARSVVYFVKKVLDEGKTQEDIGVVTPYRRQVSISPTPYTQLFTAKVR